MDENSAPDYDDRWTPDDLFQKLNEEFGFTHDACATHENSKCPSYWTKKDDALKQDWAQIQGFIWCNPPYSDLKRWVKYAHEQAEQGAKVVMLVPATRTEQDWWHEYVEPKRDGDWSILNVRFIKGRPKFKSPHGLKSASPRFGCCLLIWNL